MSTVACERPDGTLDFHEESETCEVCRFFLTVVNRRRPEIIRMLKHAQDHITNTTNWNHDDPNYNGLERQSLDALTILARVIFAVQYHVDITRL